MEKTKQTIELLAKHEEAIGNLYARYAELLSNKDFWRRLSGDEKTHAKWFRSLSGNIGGDNLDLGHEFSSERVYQSIERIKALAKEATNHSLKIALTFAYEIENMMLENDFLADFSLGGSEEKATVRRLIKATEAHRKAVKVKIDQLSEK